MSISVRELSKAFCFERALIDVSLDIGPGQIVAVLGANGAGKTTLLRCLAGIAAPDSGEILYDAHRFHRKRLDLRRRLHFLPDAPPLLGGWNVLRQLALILESYGKTADGVVQQVADLLAEFDLVEKEHLLVGGLSRGQQYKLALIALLAIDPELWLLDEPFASGMDPHGISSFRRRARAAADHGRTVIYTTQLLDLAESFSDVVCILDRGRLHAFDSIDVLRSRVRSAGGGVLEAIFQQLRDPNRPGGE